MEEIDGEIKIMKVKKAVGEDEMHAEIIKWLGEEGDVSG